MLRTMIDTSGTSVSRAGRVSSGGKGSGRAVIRWPGSRLAALDCESCQVILFRVVVAALPQLLLLLLAGGQFDLLGGWNHTDSAFGVLAALFLVTPVATAVLLIVEMVRYRKRMRQDSGARPARSRPRVAFAVLLFLEALVVDLLVVSQVRMH